MADYGLLQGLGAGLQQLGGSIFKSKVLDKLKEEEAVRAEERAVAREAKKVASQRVIRKGDGTMVRQHLNSQGDLVKEEPVDPYELEKIQREEQKEKSAAEKEGLTVQGLQQKLKLNEMELGNYEEDRGLERRVKEANIRQSEAAATRSLRPDYRETVAEIEAADEPSPGMLANQLVDEYEDLQKEYTSGDDPAMSAQEFREVAQATVLQAARRGVDARVAFTHALRAFKSNKDKKKAAPVLPTNKFKRD